MRAPDIAFVAKHNVPLHFRPRLLAGCSGFSRRSSFARRSTGEVDEKIAPGWPPAAPFWVVDPKLENVTIYLAHQCAGKPRWRNAAR